MEKCKISKAYPRSMCFNSLSLSINLKSRDNSFWLTSLSLSPIGSKLVKHIELVVEIAYILISMARNSEFRCSHKGKMKLNIEGKPEYCKLFNNSHTECECNGNKVTYCCWCNGYCGTTRNLITDRKRLSEVVLQICT